MGDPQRLPTMVDDMGGLYSHASEVHRAGKRVGRQEFFDAVINALKSISIEQESGPVNGPEALIATRGFHVAEACMKQIQQIKAAFDEQKKTV